MGKIFFILTRWQTKSLTLKVMLLAYLFASFSCSSEKIPEEVLKHEQMVPILVDMYLAESKVNELKIKRDSALIIFQVYEERIYAKHNVSYDTYRASLAYYYDHPEVLENIYETVLDSLNLLETRYQEKDEEEKDEEEADDNSETEDDQNAEVEDDEAENVKEEDVPDNEEKKKEMKTRKKADEKETDK